MSVRGQIELAQITDRLIKSRSRPKRQYLIERIGHIWSNVQHSCCFRSHCTTHQAHSDPTPESISAVTSFERDDHLGVRIAVIFALRQKSVPLGDSTPILIRMLGDHHPIVRINAALALSHVARRTLEPEVLNAALDDSAWSVRWIIAESLAHTEYSEKGWETLRSSVPSSDRSLTTWLYHCFPYYSQFAADQSLVLEIRSRKQQSPPNSMWRLLSPEFDRLLKVSKNA